VVKKPKHQDLDEHLFRQEMDGVVPLKKIPPTTNSRKPRTQNRKREPEVTSANFEQKLLSSTDNQTHVDADDGSSHRKNGVQKRIMQKLKRGQFPVGEQLDLHQMTTETGHMALLEFISDAQNKAFECIRIIHGKGLRSNSGPRLKIMTRQLLRDHPQVLAFTSCKQADGGAGAVDVLLKSK
jgi:DNA-nicking Smr family endonuclease